MEKVTRNTSQSWRHAMKSFVLPLLLAVALVTIIGCAPCEECGSLKRQHDITNLFMNNEIVPGYTYYFNGRTQWPSAIMAIEPSYTIQAEFWKPVDLEGEELSKWLDNAVNWKGPYRTSRNGAEILDPTGKRVGIFFSKYDNLVTKFDGNTIQVYPPSYLAGESMGKSSRERN